MSCVASDWNTVLCEGSLINATRMGAVNGVVTYATYCGFMDSFTLCQYASACKFSPDYNSAAAYWIFIILGVVGLFFSLHHWVLGSQAAGRYYRDPSLYETLFVQELPLFHRVWLPVSTIVSIMWIMLGSAVVGGTEKTSAPQYLVNFDYDFVNYIFTNIDVQMLWYVAYTFAITALVFGFVAFAYSSYGMTYKFINNSPPPPWIANFFQWLLAALFLMTIIDAIVIKQTVVWDHYYYLNYFVAINCLGIFVLTLYSLIVSYIAMEEMIHSDNKSVELDSRDEAKAQERSNLEEKRQQLRTRRNEFLIFSLSIIIGALALGIWLIYEATTYLENYHYRDDCFFPALINPIYSPWNVIMWVMWFCGSSYMYYYPFERKT